MPKTLGALIRERRQKLGLTQEQLAKRVGEGVRQAEISRLEHDRVSLPRRERLERIAASLDLSIGDLLVLTGWMADEHRDTLDDGAYVSQEVLAAAVEALTAARQMMTETADLLDAAERKLARTMRTIDDGSNSQGIDSQHLGISTDLESSAIVRG